MNDWLEQLYAETDPDLVCELVYDKLNASFWGDKFQEVDDILSTVDVSRLSIQAYVSLCGYSNIVSEKLPSRMAFIKRGKFLIETDPQLMNWWKLLESNKA